MNSEQQLVIRLERFNIFTSGPKAGDDKRKECEEERGGGGKEWDLDGLGRDNNLSLHTMTFLFLAFLTNKHLLRDSIGTLTKRLKPQRPSLKAGKSPNKLPAI